MRAFLTLTLLFAGVTAFANYPGKDLWIPVAGNAVGAGGRTFTTIVSITNVAPRPASVTLSFFAAAQPGQPQGTITVAILPERTYVHAVGPELARPDRPIGALRITSTEVVVADAQMVSSVAGTSNVAAVGAAIPSELAIGTGESTLLHGSTSGSRYKLYAAETHGFPLYFSVTLTDVNGRIVDSRRLYLGPHEPRSWELNGPFTTIAIRGINGSGRIVVAGAQIANDSQDTSFYEMLLPTRPRHRIAWPEWLAYGVAGAALLAAALRSGKR